MRKVYKFLVCLYVLETHKMQSYTITKQISKHGRQAVIVLPKLLEAELRPGTVAEIKITVIKEAENSQQETRAVSK
jgi:hypothetical protein